MKEYQQKEQKKDKEIVDLKDEIKNQADANNKLTTELNDKKNEIQNITVELNQCQKERDETRKDPRRTRLKSADQMEREEGVSSASRAPSEENRRSTSLCCRTSPTSQRPPV